MSISRSITRRSLLACGAAGLMARPLGALAAPADSGAGRIVVELFTSQGCSSCPPADAFLAELARRDDVIALSLPIDYWDFLGWKDTLADPAFTQRQRAYADALGIAGVYTPQMVIDGSVDAVGSRRALVEEAVTKREMARTANVSLIVSPLEDRLRIRIGEGPVASDATLWLARFSRKIEVKIDRGENRGRTLTYTNVVRDFSPVAMWTGKPLEIDLAKKDLRGPGYDGCALLLQEKGVGPILAATEIRLDA